MGAHARLRQLLIGGAVALATFAGGPAAWAVLQKLTAIGGFTAVAPGSPLETALGLQTGDPFVAMAVYDDALLSGIGAETVELNPAVNPGSSFDLTIAELLIFDQTDDTDFGSGFPQIVFFDGSFDGFDFLSNPFDVAGVPVGVSLGPLLLLGDIAQNELQALGEFREVSAEPVSPD
jgi:hypothetical protein